MHIPVPRSVPEHSAITYPRSPSSVSECRTSTTRAAGLRVTHDAASVMTAAPVALRASTCPAGPQLAPRLLSSAQPTLRLKVSDVAGLGLTILIIRPGRA